MKYSSLFAKATRVNLNLTLVVPKLQGSLEKISYNVKSEKKYVEFIQKDFFELGREMANKADNEKASVVIMDPPYLFHSSRVIDTHEFCLGIDVDGGPEEETEEDLIHRKREEIVQCSIDSAIQCCTADAYILMWGNMEMIYYAKVEFNLI